MKNTKKQNFLKLEEVKKNNFLNKVMKNKTTTTKATTTKAITKATTKEINYWIFNEENKTRKEKEVIQKFKNPLQLFFEEKLKEHAKKNKITFDAIKEHDLLLNKKQLWKICLYEQPIIENYEEEEKIKAIEILYNVLFDCLYNTTTNLNMFWIFKTYYKSSIIEWKYWKSWLKYDLKSKIAFEYAISQVFNNVIENITKEEKHISLELLSKKIMYYISKEENSLDSLIEENSNEEPITNNLQEYINIKYIIENINTTTNWKLAKLEKIIQEKEYIENDYKIKRLNWLTKEEKAKEYKEYSKKHINTINKIKRLKKDIKIDLYK